MTDERRLTPRQAAIVGAYTGVLCGPFSDLHAYAEQVLGRGVWTHEFGNRTVADDLKEAAKADFISICCEAVTE